MMLYPTRPREYCSPTHAERTSFVRPQIGRELPQLQQPHNFPILIGFIASGIRRSSRLTHPRFSCLIAEAFCNKSNEMDFSILPYPSPLKFYQWKLFTKRIKKINVDSRKSSTTLNGPKNNVSPSFPKVIVIMSWK